MADTRRYWKQVKETEAAIKEPFVYVTSLDNESNGWRGGRTCEVTREMAARFLTDGSHLLSTEEQIKQYQDEQAEVRRKASKSQAKRIGDIMARTILGAGDDAVDSLVSDPPPVPAEKSKK